MQQGEHNCTSSRLGKNQKDRNKKAAFAGSLFADVK